VILAGIILAFDEVGSALIHLAERGNLICLKEKEVSMVENA
jgi:hypothetical protein